MALKAKPGSGEEEVEVEVDAGDARASAIEQAWNEAEEDAGEKLREGAEAAADEEPGEEPVEEESGEEGDEDEDEGQPRDEHGRFAKKDGEDESGGEGAAAAEGQDGEGQDGEGGAAPGAAGDPAAAAAGVPGSGEQQPALKAPASLRPAERVAFDALKGPEAQVVKQAMVRREAQIESALRETEGARQFANEFIRRAEPYRGLYAMLNTSPLAAFDVLMRSAAVLYQGDAHMKARVVADLIRERGIDPELVADHLDGKTSDGRPVAAPDPHIAQLTQTVQSLQSQLAQQREEDARRAQELADRHVQDWAKDKPWFSDVRKRMTALIKAAEQEGEELTLDQAYATAIAMDPELSKLEAQRKKAEAVKAQKARMEKARRAASSPRPSPVRRPAGTPTGDRRKDVESAWEEAEGRIAS